MPIGGQSLHARDAVACDLEVPLVVGDEVVKILGPVPNDHPNRLEQRLVGGREGEGRPCWRSVDYTTHRTAYHVVLTVRRPEKDATEDLHGNLGWQRTGEMRREGRGDRVGNLDITEHDGLLRVQGEYGSSRGLSIETPRREFHPPPYLLLLLQIRFKHDTQILNHPRLLIRPWVDPLVRVVISAYSHL